MRALAKDPDQRYASAEEMDADLARVARGGAGVAADRGGDDAGPGADTAAATAIVPRAAATPAAGAARLPAALLLRGRPAAGARRGR